MTQPPYRGLNRSFLEEEGGAPMSGGNGGSHMFSAWGRRSLQSCSQRPNSQDHPGTGEAHQELEQGRAGVGNLGGPP